MNGLKQLTLPSHCRGGYMAAQRVYMTLQGGYMMMKATYTAITLPALQAGCFCLEIFCVGRNLGWSLLILLGQMLNDTDEVLKLCHRFTRSVNQVLSLLAWLHPLQMPEQSLISTKIKNSSRSTDMSPSCQCPRGVINNEH